ncbi:glutamate ABC transporter substrate-binding protein [Streptomyces sp. Je 1-4]|uniref:glutamate ABC transporter substrate-binding protein n=1 Tax=Streptomyces TaxID=1883 RepID=UPI00140F1256|nr:MULTISPECIES: glutamate ABC transporter substrate-binding protein [unclassified Streptomyces]QIK06237.1 glutamate ABC transporter substrate-binding protein [Streptomyces sp. ID38640]UYB39581.1 glutamate ABC transporter substrate-binding protein [Streptomyces sp. Je 1-4]UZQ35623.1 glutamate ABC transporter substrate-binding protein [Streptomyces sp. Je 1-4] [Streptomyces sp. Je 1-4 4N24]UZQ43041.1 glutamate ABC transporter substrate-binding protein [Streptomyces sp. Je 1-4] [Streptomyces sp. 
MRIRKTAAAGAVVLALAATATACGGEKGAAGDKPAGGDVFSGNYKVASAPKIDSAVLKKAQKAKKIVIGVKADQPFLGFKDTTGKYSGFDIEIAKMVAADLGFSEKQIEFKTIDSNVRETTISNGQVDYYVGTYTINDERKKQVGFAGPYYTAGADLLVRKDEKDITGPDALKGKEVCSIVGSTPLQEIKKKKYGAKTSEQSKYSDCVKSLLDGQVDAVTTDDAILKGYAAQRPEKLRVVGKSFTKEPYGVGMKKDDKALRNAITDALENHIKNGDYKKAYDGTLGKSGSKFVAPETPLPRY